MKMLCHLKDKSEWLGDNMNITLVILKVTNTFSLLYFPFRLPWWLLLQLDSHLLVTFLRFATFLWLLSLKTTLFSFSNTLSFIEDLLSTSILSSNIVFAKNNIVSGQYKHEHNWPLQLTISLYAFSLYHFPNKFLYWRLLLNEIWRNVVIQFVVSWI